MWDQAYREISQALTDRGIKTPLGGDVWNQGQGHARDKTIGHYGQMNGSRRDVTADPPRGGKFCVGAQLIFASASTTAGIISGRMGSLQWLDPAKVARCFRLP
jgi:hypothetical protein